VPVFIFPMNRVAQLYPQALGPTNTELQVLVIEPQHGSHKNASSFITCSFVTLKTICSQSCYLVAAVVCIHSCYLTVCLHVTVGGAFLASPPTPRS
jgi:hypothetical protein